MSRFARLITPLLIMTTTTPALATGSDAMDDDSATYVQEVDAWHQDREERLRQPGSWLTLVGLIALSDGTQRLGCGSTAELQIAAECEPWIGDVVTDTTGVRFVAHAAVTHDGQPVEEIQLAADTTGNPTVLECGTISFFLIERHDRPYLRVKDSAVELLTHFPGIDRWPVDPAWRVQAQWVAYEKPQMHLLPDVLGVPTEQMVAGEARFTLAGQECVLFPNEAGDDGLFWVFGDATNGLTSYGGGRFLYSDPPAEDGTVILDFNRAYNPPCVFTPYATCPLPAEGNTLDLEVTAGEQMFGAAH